MSDKAEQKEIEKVKEWFTSEEEKLWQDKYGVSGQDASKFQVGSNVYFRDVVYGIKMQLKRIIDSNSKAIVKLSDNDDAFHSVPLCFIQTDSTYFLWNKKVKPYEIVHQKSEAVIDLKCDVYGSLQYDLAKSQSSYFQLARELHGVKVLVLGGHIDTKAGAWRVKIRLKDGNNKDIDMLCPFDLLKVIKNGAGAPIVSNVKVEIGKQLEMSHFMTHIKQRLCDNLLKFIVRGPHYTINYLNFDCESKCDVEKGVDSQLNGNVKKGTDSANNDDNDIDDEPPKKRRKIVETATKK